MSMLSTTAAGYYSPNKSVCGEVHEGNFPTQHASLMTQSRWNVTLCAGALWTRGSFKVGVNSGRRPAGSFIDREYFYMMETQSDYVSAQPVQSEFSRMSHDNCDTKASVTSSKSIIKHKLVTDIPSYVYLF